MSTGSELYPKDMQWLEKGVLGIEWSDGHHGVYPVRVLRLHCPCAACVDEWSGERRLKPDDVPLFIMAQDIQPVGRYALQFSWSDGHDTGRRLRVEPTGSTMPAECDSARPALV